MFIRTELIFEKKCESLTLEQLTNLINECSDLHGEHATVSIPEKSPIGTFSLVIESQVGE